MPGNEGEAAEPLDAYLARADTAARLAQVPDLGSPQIVETGGRSVGRPPGAHPCKWPPAPVALTGVHGEITPRFS